MKQAKFFARALGIAIAVPMSGIIALSGVGASAASCPPGTSPVMQNGVAGCASTGAGGSSTPPAGNDGSSTASPQPVTPVRTADPEDPSPTQPITPMTPTSDPNVPQPAPVMPTPVASSLPPEPSPDGGRPSSNASPSSTATPMPTESSSANKPGGTATGAPREVTVGGTGKSGGATQESYPPALSEVKVEQVAPGAASEAQPFNPAGIFIAALSGLLAVLVGLLFWVNKRHATKKAP